MDKKNEMVKIISPKGQVSEISKRSWEENKLSMPEWKLFDIHEESIEIKSDKVTKKTK